MSPTGIRGRINLTLLRRFLDSEAAAGLLLMGAAALAIVTANSPLAEAYFHALHVHIGPASLQHWINDALMAAFFLLVGLEIKREMLDGQLSSWQRRLLPGAAAAGGMLVPALIFVAFNAGNPDTMKGWAVPTATDIAFALGVMQLLGDRVPITLKIFLTALAIIDDLGAVAVIALFYTDGINVPALAAAAAVLAALNRLKVMALAPYLVLGAALWLAVYLSGVHATVAGVLLALTVPLRPVPDTLQAKPGGSPLHRLEHALHKPVAFFVVPVFGFANAGVSFDGMPLSALADPTVLGIGIGLLAGKVAGVFGAVLLLYRLGWSGLPAGSSWGQVFGVSLLCGIGFTMSLFVALLAFPDPAMLDRARLGILIGSVLSGLGGYAALRLAGSRASS